MSGLAHRGSWTGSLQGCDPCVPLIHHCCWSASACICYVGAVPEVAFGCHPCSSPCPSTGACGCDLHLCIIACRWCYEHLCSCQGDGGQSFTRGSSVGAHRRHPSRELETPSFTEVAAAEFERHLCTIYLALEVDSLWSQLGFRPCESCIAPCLMNAKACRSPGSDSPLGVPERPRLPRVSHC